MAKRRKTTTSKGSKRKKQKTSKIDLAVVSLIFISVLLVVLIYTNSGYLGEHLSPALGGVMGWMKYILPIGTFILSVYLVIDSEEREYMASKLVQYVAFLLCIATVMCIYQMSKGIIDINADSSTILKEAYSLGEKNIGGGIIGALIAIPLTKLLGMLGAVILTVGLGIILLIFMFGLRPSELINKFLYDLKDKRDERLQEEQEEVVESKEERKNRIKQERLEKKKAKESKKEQEELPMEEQITINLNGRDPENEKNSKLKKYKHGKDDLVPLNKETNNKNTPDYIEANLFKQEETKKEEKTKEVLQLEHAVTVEDEHYEFPPIQLLSKGEVKAIKGGKKAVADIATKLQKTLYSFGVSAKVENVSVGPAITRYELKPAEGVRVNKIANLADDIALNLAAETIRIEAPIPGKQAVGIEVPNKENEVVHLRDVIESNAFKNHPSKLGFALGKNVAGEEVIADIASMPHVLIAGSTGSGKSVCINTIITSIIYKAKPSEVKLVMVDPKVVELSVYNGIPHLLIPVVTDPKKAAGALAWAVQEMVNRYSLFAEKGVRDIKGYNEALEKENGGEKLPQIVIIIDELADLMMVAPNDVEDAVCRLAQMARAAGMHLVIATQRPSVDVITGIIKANIPSRIAFAVSSQVDSRTILDMVGAEKLLGKGDMLFYPSGVPKPIRVQGSFVSDKEVEKIVDFLKSNGEASYSEDIIEKIETAKGTDKEVKEKDDDDDTDELLMEAIDVVVETRQASTSFIQRRFKVGYARAGRIIDQMEERGIISGYQGSKPREVLMTKERLAELKMGQEVLTEQE